MPCQHMGIWGRMEGSEADSKLHYKEIACYSVQPLIFLYKQGCPGSLGVVLSKQLRAIFVNFMCFYPSFEN